MSDVEFPVRVPSRRLQRVGVQTPAPASAPAAAGSDSEDPEFDDPPRVGPRPPPGIPPPPVLPSAPAVAPAAGGPRRRKQEANLNAGRIIPPEEIAQRRAAEAEAAAAEARERDRARREAEEADERERRVAAAAAAEAERRAAEGAAQLPDVPILLREADFDLEAEEARVEQERALEAVGLNQAAEQGPAIPQGLAPPADGALAAAAAGGRRRPEPVRPSAKPQSVVLLRLHQGTPGEQGAFGVETPLDREHYRSSETGRGVKCLASSPLVDRVMKEHGEIWMRAQTGFPATYLRNGAPKPTIPLIGRFLAEGARFEKCWKGNQTPTTGSEAPGFPVVRGQDGSPNNPGAIASFALLPVEHEFRRFGEGSKVVGIMRRAQQAPSAHHVNTILQGSSKADVVTVRRRTQRGLHDTHPKASALAPAVPGYVYPPEHPNLAGPDLRFHGDFLVDLLLGTWDQSKHAVPLSQRDKATMERNRKDLSRDFAATCGLAAEELLSAHHLDVLFFPTRHGRAPLSIEDRVEFANHQAVSSAEKQQKERDELTRRSRLTDDVMTLVSQRHTQSFEADPQLQHIGDVYDELFALKEAGVMLTAHHVALLAKRAPNAGNAAYGELERRLGQVYKHIMVPSKKKTQAVLFYGFVPRKALIEARAAHYLDSQRQELLAAAPEEELMDADVDEYALTDADFVNAAKAQMLAWRAGNGAFPGYVFGTPTPSRNRYIEVSTSDAPTGTVAVLPNGELCRPFAMEHASANLFLASRRRALPEGVADWPEAVLGPMDAFKTVMPPDMWAVPDDEAHVGLYSEFYDDFGLWLKQGPWDKIFDGIKGGLNMTNVTEALVAVWSTRTDEDVADLFDALSQPPLRVAAEYANEWHAREERDMDYYRRAFYWLATVKLRVLQVGDGTLSMPPIQHEAPLLGQYQYLVKDELQRPQGAPPNEDSIYERTMNNVADEGPYRAKYGGLVVGERDWHLTPEQRHYAAKATRDAARADFRSERAAALRQATDQMDALEKQRDAVAVDVDAVSLVQQLLYREADIVVGMLKKSAEAVQGFEGVPLDRAVLLDREANDFDADVRGAADALRDLENRIARYYGT